ncbi:MAG: hypothetical protein PVI01_02685 [Gemmatimonadales bacterium]|jgi:hypothetical protein
MSKQPLYSLASAPPAARWAVTLYLGLLGTAYAFGLLMVVLWAGLTPQQLARTYREPKAGVAGERPQVSERPIDLSQAVAGEEVHQIDTRLLVQDTHVHVPVYALIALSLSGIALGLSWRPRFQLVLVFALFSGPVLDFLGMWLTKLVADGFAYLTLLGGWLMAAAYLVVALTAIKQIWFETDDKAPPDRVAA